MDRGRAESVSGAEVAKLVDATVSNTVALNGRAGSSPAFGTNNIGRPLRGTLPSGVTVAPGPLEPLV